MGGHNLSRFAGSGQEFLDHRNFHQGDDLRAVNWRAYMRLEKLFLKMFQVEPRVPVRLLLDTSASMLAHGGVKFDYARKLAAALCYVGLVRLDTIEVHGFADRMRNRVIAVAAGATASAAWPTALQAMKAAGAHRLQRHGARVHRHYSRSAAWSSSFRISWTTAIANAPCNTSADFGHELMLLQI